MNDAPVPQQPHILDLDHPRAAANYRTGKVGDIEVEGLPVHWKHSDELLAVVGRFKLHLLEPGDLQKVIAFIQHHIHAPCYFEKYPYGELPAPLARTVKVLRQRSLDLQTLSDVDNWVLMAAGYGLDPF